MKTFVCLASLLSAEIRHMALVHIQHHRLMVGRLGLEGDWLLGGASRHEVGTARHRKTARVLRVDLHPSFLARKRVEKGVSRTRID